MEFFVTSYDMTWTSKCTVGQVGIRDGRRRAQSRFYQTPIRASSEASAHFVGGTRHSGTGPLHPLVRRLNPAVGEGDDRRQVVKTGKRNFQTRLGRGTAMSAPSEVSRLSKSMARNRICTK